MATVKHKRYAREVDIPTSGLNPGEFIAALDTRKIFFCWSTTEREEIVPDLSLADKSYRHIQSTPSLIWNITHALSKYPAVTITDSSGSELEGDVQHIDNQSLILTFSAPFSGFADLN